jgi:hypothetical protein
MMLSVRGLSGHSCRMSPEVDVLGLAWQMDTSQHGAKQCIFEFVQSIQVKSKTSNKGDLTIEKKE